MRVFIALLLMNWLLLVASVRADMTTSADLEIPEKEKLLDMLDKNFDLGFSIGQVVYTAPDGTTENIPKISASPKIKLSHLTAGFDVNFLVTDEKKRDNLGDTAKNEFVVDFVSYQTKRFLARWGEINGMTLGQGLIMNNYYSTARTTSALYSNDDKAALLDIKTKLGLTAFWTQTQITGGRLSYHLGRGERGLILGGTFITDRNQPTTKGDQLTVFGVDAFWPIFARKTGIGVEWAKIKDFGSGFSAGFQLGGNSIRWTNSFRNFDSDFQPSIFDSHYETHRAGGDKFSPGVGDVKNGFLSQLDLFFSIPTASGTEGTLRVTGAYEDYENVEPRLIAEAYARVSGGEGYFKDLRAKLTYEQQNYRLTSGLPTNGIWKGELAMPLNDHLDLILRYTRTMDPIGNDVQGFTTDFAFRL